MSNIFNSRWKPLNIKCDCGGDVGLRQELKLSFSNPDDKWSDKYRVQCTKCFKFSKSNSNKQIAIQNWLDRKFIRPFIKST